MHQAQFVSSAPHGKEFTFASFRLHEHGLTPPDTQAQLLNQAEAFEWPLLKLKQEKFRLSVASAPVPARPAHPGFLLGDCTQLLESIPDNSLNLLVTDPPYGLDYESEHREVN